MKVVACYIRISLGGKSQAAQRRGINQWLKSKRIDSKSVRWYIDKAPNKRDAFAKLQADVANREIGTIVLWHLDRLASSIFGGLKILSEWLKQPLRIVSVSQDIDFKGGAGKAITGVVQGLAEMAYETARERTSAGVATARRLGRTGGRPRITADNPKVQEAKKLHKAGKLTIDQICKKLEISQTTYFRYLDL